VQFFFWATLYILLLGCLYRVSGNNRLRNDLLRVEWVVKLCVLTALCVFTVARHALREAKVCRNLPEISWRFSTRLTSAVSPACAIATGYDPWRSTTQHGNTTPSAAGDAHMSTRYNDVLRFNIKSNQSKFILAANQNTI